MDRRGPPPGSVSLDPPLAPLDVRPERVLRTEVCLRPYRPGGFVVRAERFGADKTLVHNYGHGGSGVTLAPGTGEIAAGLALDAAAERGAGAGIAVLGCGVVGLDTARALLAAQPGRPVTIYAAERSPHVTSDIAGAIWAPYFLYDPGAVDAAWLALFERALRMAHARFAALTAAPRYGVRWIRDFVLLGDGRGAPTAFPDLFPGIGLHPEAARRFGVAEIEAFHTLMIDPDVYLAALTEDVTRGGGRFVTRRFETTADVAALDEPVIVNCTGLGARELFGDAALTPVRGQITLLAPQPEVDYAYARRTGAGGFLYMYPRKSGIVLGGTNEPGVADRTVDPATLERVLSQHAAIAARLAG